MSKKIYRFNEGDSRLVHLLGGKGAGLCRAREYYPSFKEQ